MIRPRTLLLASSVLWLLGFVFLFLYLATRTNTGVSNEFSIWQALHDGTMALATLSIAAAAWRLRSTATRSGASLGAPLAWLGTISGLATAILLALVSLTGANDMLYMSTQGGLGLWLLALTAKKPDGFGIPAQVLGFITGSGLVLIACAFVVIAIALGPTPFALANASYRDVAPSHVSSPLNSNGHLVLYAGTLLGIPTFPIWAFLAWRGLRRSGAS